ncbi:restriction endonuclease subunit S [Photobacterium kagoshimensis]|uniref:restriction endonuclease subunit S n=1 Tax=Photobacterium kagoshimensis TaxID=2910242 RepID=UPI003D141C5F
MSLDQTPINQLIADNIDTWTSTVKTKATTGRGSSKKLELYGVKKLRELILELAVRGKLVPQDPTDEPASVLLERIAEEKAQLVKDKKISKTKKLPSLTEEEKSIDLPNGWALCRFGDLYHLEYGDNLPKVKRSGSGEYPVYGSNGIVGTHNIFSVDEACVVIGRKGSAGALNMSATPCWVTDVAYSVIPPTGIELDYCFLHLNTFGLDSLGKGIKPGLNRNEANVLVACIPPTAEQHRIVAKVDELMTLCDQLEQQTEASIEAHQVLVTTLLDTLTNSADADELMQNWARISEHFDTLFTTEASIDQLKQTILQLAVMGKLVPQDPTDEPAAKLLERIAEEKAHLIKEKKIKKQKALPPIADDEKPFELPNGWEWCRFGELGYDLGGGTPSKGNSEYWGGSIPWVSPKDMKRDYIESAIDSVTEKAVLETTIKLIPENSLLMVVRGMILAHSFPVALTKKPVVINQDMKALIYNYIEPEFLLVVMKGIKNEMVDLVDRSSHGTCKLVSDKLWSVVLAVPPLSQQRQIVKKANELLGICEQLKGSLKESQTTQLHLTDAIVEQAV